MIHTPEQAGKDAFESFLRARGLRYDDLTKKDNRSQSSDGARNLDYRVYLPESRELLVELESHAMKKGRIQPSQCWLKGNELEALLNGEKSNPRCTAMAVFAFRSELDPINFKGPLNRPHRTGHCE